MKSRTADFLNQHDDLDFIYSGYLPFQESVVRRLQQIENAHSVKAFFEKKGELWSSDPEAQELISHRLGWLNAPWDCQEMVTDLQSFTRQLQNDGIEFALLLGMGGSSLAAETFRLTFGIGGSEGFPGINVTILDSTNPEYIASVARRFPMEKTIYIVSSKSGSTIEVDSLFAFFWKRARKRLRDRLPQHFIAITDSGSNLETRAKAMHMRRIFLGDADVGGRFSALTAFGLVPAAMMGIDLPEFIERAQIFANQCSAEVPVMQNPAVVLGAILGEAYIHGRDKCMILCDPQIQAIGAWLEQLIAESSGKSGKGIIPIDLEPLMPADRYTNDRLVVYLRQSGEHDKFVRQLINRGRSVITIDIIDEYALGAEFYRWEIAISIACMIIGINGFDQPDVQDNKDRTSQKIREYSEKGVLNEGVPAWSSANALVYGATGIEIDDQLTLSEITHRFLLNSVEGDYIAINAYLPRNAVTLQRLQKLREKVQRLTGKPTTLGFGPRFLHSTGQLHKGGKNNGVFLQITKDSPKVLPIPEKKYTFNVLERAQALGDLEALVARGRRVMRVHLINDKIDDILIET